MLKLCEEISKNVEEKIVELINTEEGAKFVRVGNKTTQMIDAVAEKACFDIIEESSIPMLVISEESGVRKFGKEKSEYVCLLDPLDGSFNALHNIPFFAVSIAFAKKNELFFGYVKNLYNQDFFYAEKGRKVIFNGRKIKSKFKNKNLRESVISFYPPKKSLDNKVFGILNKVLTFRTLGSAALEICYVAIKKLDAFIDLRNTLRNIDIAAASLILTEAGGMVSKKNLNLKKIEQLSIIASNPYIYEEILGYVQ